VSNCQCIGPDYMLGLAALFRSANFYYSPITLYVSRIIRVLNKD
jgi:hypothetical protein